MALGLELDMDGGQFAQLKVVGIGGAGNNAVTVSYTHLTLPTILRV